MKIRAMRVHSFSSPDCSLARVTNPLIWFLGRILVGRLSETRPSQRFGFSVYKCLMWLFSLVVCSQGGSVYFYSAISNSPTRLLKLVIAQTGLQNPIKNTDDKQRSFRCPAFRPSRVLCAVLPPKRIQNRLSQRELLLQS